ncbi:unnamed protein product, partial [Onchocerca ochengi]|uniref:ATP-dependent DNA helicase n=1 Tax=Onchocerca ochengi TaxID=42157 RepID=A0A182EUU1_ONCOC
MLRLLITCYAVTLRYELMYLMYLNEANQLKKNASSFYVVSKCTRSNLLPAITNCQRCYTCYFPQCMSSFEFIGELRQWDVCIYDACNMSHPNQIRTLFAIILTASSPSSPAELWEKYKSYMAGDILHRIRSENSNMNIDFTAEIYNEALIMIEDLFLQIANKVLNQLGLPSPNRSAAASFDVELHHEQNYNIADLSSYVQSNISKLTFGQKSTYDRIMQSVNRGVGEIFFLDAPGETGKTFLITLILATIRSQNGIALALASSGISATLLPGGRTAHSTLKLPVNTNLIETSTCNISKTSGMGKILQKCKLTVWDECTMAHKKSIEALDRSLQDLRGNIRPFGNALILFAGDFRQTLPVILRSTPADE